MSSPIEPAPGQPVPGTGQSGPRISRRVAAIAESATLAIDAKAKALKAMGEDVIAFGAGEPDFPTPDHIVEAAVAASHQTRFHHYTPTAGLPELREAVAAKTARDSGYQVQPGQVLVTNGGKRSRRSAAGLPRGACGSSPTRSTSTWSTATTSSTRCRWSCPSWPTGRWWSTAWPRPTR